MPIDPETFKAVMRQLASGITVVTSRREGEDFGFTASSFTGLSMDPPLVLVCVDRRQNSHDVVEAAGFYGVSVLSADQLELGVRFAQHTPADRFAGITPRRELTGAALIPGALAWVDCRVHEVLSGGDHSIFVGEVLAGDASAVQGALLYYDRQWGTFSPVSGP